MKYKKAGNDCSIRRLINRFIRWRGLKDKNDQDFYSCYEIFQLGFIIVCYKFFVFMYEVVYFYFFPLLFLMYMTIYGIDLNQPKIVKLHGLDFKNLNST